jgi:hypothetical protein
LSAQRATNAANKAQASVVAQASPYSLTHQLQQQQQAAANDGASSSSRSSYSASGSRSGGGGASAARSSGPLEPLSRPQSGRSSAGMAAGTPVRVPSAGANGRPSAAAAAPSGSPSLSVSGASASQPRPSSNSSSIRAAAAASLAAASPVGPPRIPSAGRTPAGSSSSASSRR